MAIINTAVTGDTIHSSVKTYDAVFLDGTIWKTSTGSVVPDGVYGGSGIIYSTVSYLSGRYPGELDIDLYFTPTAIGTLTATLTLTSDLTATATMGMTAEGVTKAGITYIDDHETEAFDKLLQQYKGKTIENLIRAVGTNQIQDLEDALKEFWDLFNVDLAYGVHLDRIGNVVGLRRNKLSDSSYRKFLKAKIIANSTNGHFDDVFAAWTHLSQSDNAQVEEIYPAEINLLTDTYINSADITLIVELMDDCLAAGVGIGYIKYNNFDSTYFSFADGDGLGFGSLSSAVGGKLASLIWHHS